jgi:hypothetical protein
MCQTGGECSTPESTSGARRNSQAQLTHATTLGTWKLLCCERLSSLFLFYCLNIYRSTKCRGRPGLNCTSRDWRIHPHAHDIAKTPAHPGSCELSSACPFYAHGWSTELELVHMQVGNGKHAPNCLTEWARIISNRSPPKPCSSSVHQWLQV